MICVAKLVSLSALSSRLAGSQSLPERNFGGLRVLSFVQRSAHLVQDSSSFNKTNSIGQFSNEETLRPDPSKMYGPFTSFFNNESMASSEEAEEATSKQKQEARKDLQERLSIYRFFKDEPWEVTRARAIHALEEWVMRLRDFMVLFAWTTIF